MTTAAQEVVSTLTSSHTPRSRDTRRRDTLGKPFWIFFAVSTLFALCFSAYFFLYAVYLVEVGFTEVQIGRIAASLAFGSIVGTLPMASLARRRGIGRTVMCCIPLSASASALRICLPSYSAQIALGFVAGLMLCSWAVCLAPSVASLTSDRTRAFAFSVIFASGIAITGLGTLLAAQVPHMLQAALPRMQLSIVNAHRIVAVLACLLAASSMVPLRFLSLQRPLTPAQPSQSLNPFLLRFLLAVALWTFASAAFSPFVAIFFTRHHGLSVQQFGFVLSCSQAAQAAGVLLAPTALRRFGLGPSMMTAQLTAACVLILLALARIVVLVEVLYWTYIAFTCLSEPCLHTMLMTRVAPGQRPGASAAHQLVAGVTVGLAALLVGSLIARFGYHLVFSLLAACTLVSAALFCRLSVDAKHAEL